MSIMTFYMPRIVYILNHLIILGNTINFPCFSLCYVCVENTSYERKAYWVLKGNKKSIKIGCICFVSIVFRKKNQLKFTHLSAWEYFLQRIQRNERFFLKAPHRSTLMCSFYCTGEVTIVHGPRSLKF